MLKPFKILEKREVGKAGKLTLVEVDLETPEGKQVTWGYAGCKDVAVVLPLDSENNVYIKKEWRLNRDDFTWEIVGGMVESENPTDEDALATAHREIQEEVGVKANSVEKLITIYPFNHVRNRAHLFLARDLEESKLPTDEHEFLEVRKVPFAEAYDLVMNQQEPTAQNALIFSLVKSKLGL